jgi:hypothetical protein
MPDDAEDVGLALLGVDGIAHGFAIDGQALVKGGHLCVPTQQGAIEGIGVDACEDVSDARAAGYLVAAVSVAAAKAGTGGLAEVLSP